MQIENKMILDANLFTMIVLDGRFSQLIFLGVLGPTRTKCTCDRTGPRGPQLSNEFCQFAFWCGNHVYFLVCYMFRYVWRLNRVYRIHDGD